MFMSQLPGGELVTHCELSHVIVTVEQRPVATLQ